MKLAIDVYYYENKAQVAGVLFDNWESEEPIKVITTTFDNVAGYKAGRFYERELPCIMELLKLIDINSIDTIIVDGYVYLENMNSPGLGLHLYNILERKCHIIGVAKTYYHNNIGVKVLRGKSKAPLYITSIGIEPKEAGKHIENMFGNYRMPKLLKLLDQKTKNI